MTSSPADPDSFERASEENLAASPTRWEQVQGAGIFVAILWIVYFLDLVLPGDWTRWGLAPRTLSGMIGIVTMPFLHGGFGHLLSNTIPLSILLVVLGLSRAHSWIIVAGIALLGGILLWLLGRYADHIGASGLVYGLAVYLIVAGLLEKQIVSMLIAIGVLFLFGTTLIWGVLPIGNRGVSWDGHLMGAIAGGVIAWAGTALSGREKKEAD